MRSLNREILVLIFSLNAGLARAQTVGATHLLSRGPGAEAAALGNSIVSTVQDPTALYWNPAGLASAGGAATGEHLFLYDGARYDFLGLSVPSRFGTAALGALQLSRGGIIARNAIDDPGTQVTDSETDYLVGFAKSLGEHWAAGAAANILNYNLAGYSDKSVGLDIGGRAVYPGNDWWWLRQTLWSFGGVIKNLVEPQLKLIDDVETFPRELRGGMGLSFDVLSRASTKAGTISHDRGTILLSFKKVSGMPGVQPGLGFTYTYQNTLVFRLGYDGVASMGFGLHTGDGRFVIDYALENTPLSYNHRFTVSYKFIKPKTSSDAPVEHEVDEEYLSAKAKSEALANEYFTKGQELFKDRKYGEALVPLELATLLEPDNKEKSETYARAIEVRRRDMIRDLISKINPVGNATQAYEAIAQLLDLKPANRAELIEILQKLPARMTAEEYEKLSKEIYATKSSLVSDFVSQGAISDAAILAENLELFKSSYTAQQIDALKIQAAAGRDAYRRTLQAVIQDGNATKSRIVQAALALKRAYPDDAQAVSQAETIRQQYQSTLSLTIKERFYLRKLYYLAAARYAKKEEGSGDLINEILRQNAADSAANTLKEVLLRKGLMKPEFVNK